jgi:Putative prokaryotic signal transducing protein
MTRRGKVIPFPKRQPPPGPAPALVPASELVEILRCRDESEALVVRALLDGHGIPAVMRGQLVHSVHPFSVGDAGEVTLLVHAIDADRARLLLAGD